MEICGEKYYEIVIIDKTKKDKLYYHKGGNILFNTPTLNRSEARVYYSYGGARNALKKVQEHIGKNLKARIQVFHANII